MDTVVAALYNTSRDLTEISIEKDGTIIYPSSDGKSTQEIINTLLKDSNSKEYKEKIVEVTTDGIYRIAEDGTRVTITPGTTKVYIFYSDNINN